MRKKKKLAPGDAKAQPPPQSSQSPRLKASLLSLEPRLMFDAAAAATAVEVNTEQVAQEQAEAAVSGENARDSQTQKGSDSRDLLQAISTFMPNESQTEVVFVDPTVPNYQELLNGMDPNIEVVMLDGGQDGVEQMATALSGRTGIDAIHLISHGSAGQLQLGTGMLNAESMSGQYADELATIRHVLSEQADILVYGCDFAEGDTGQAAVNLLAELTGADVQASTDETGNISLGGDWEFEVSTGTIETSLAVGYDSQRNWAGILGTETVRDTFSSTSYSNNNGTQSWSTSWSDTDVGGGGAGGGDVRVSSNQLRIDTDTMGNAASRGVNLSGATSATLTFTYSNTLTGADRIEARVSNNNGATYVTLAGGVFSNALNTRSGSVSLDISGYASANTRIQFIVTGTGGGDRLYVDNVQVSYNTGLANTAPTITSQDAGSTASVTVAENSTVVTTVTAADADAGQTLGYSIAGGADAAKFTIDSNTGELRFASAPNYEVPTDSGGNNVYDVTVQVSDGQGGTDTQAIAVTVADANEAPTDLALSANTVAENAANGTVVGAVSGTDPDAGDTKTYSLTDTAGGRFAINSSTGQITVADGSLLNYEAATSHSVTVRVMDSGGQSYDETFTIQLTNANEAPTITSNGGGATVSLNVAENQTTVTTVAAVDVDTGTTLTYSLAGGPDAARFSIDGTTGALRFSAAPNFERASDVGRNNVYDVTVRVSDGQGGTTTQAISVRVTDVNEAPTIGSNGGRDTASITIRENDTTVTTVRSTDPDGGARITYSVVGGADAALFTINPSTGVLRFSSATNFEQPTDTDRNNVYQVVVQASDGRGGTDSQVISVRVTNVNEAPTDLSLSANTVAENAANGTVVGTVTGTDPDAGDTKTYSCTDSAGGRFAINRSTGVITVANGALLNYEAASSHNVTVRVTDRGGLTYNETFTIHLTDVNEAVPTITSNGGGATASVTISENTTAVTTVTATDADTRQTLTYSISGGADAAKFTINSATGALSFVSAPNYESPTDSGGNNVYDVTVQVSDGNRRTDTQAIAVTVTNMNETPTDLSLSGNTVAEQAATGTVVGTITGTDHDAGDTKTYSMTDTAGGRFAINSSTGQLTVADGTLLNYEAATSHSVTVRVTDAGGLTYDETFTINLTNVNEAPTGADATVTLNEDTAHTLTPANFGFSDVDAGDSLSAVRIDTLPSAGVLTLSGVAVTAGQVVSVADLTAGYLVFTPVANATGTGYASVTFSVRDSHSAYDATPNTLTVDVMAANDAPVNSVPEGQTVNEDTPLSLSGISVTDVDGNLSTVQLGVLNGTVSVTLQGGATISAGSNGTNSLTLSGSQADINATLATLRYQGTLNYNGADTLTVTSMDTNSGSDVDTVAITVTSQNDAPTLIANTGSTVVEGGTDTIESSELAVTDVEQTAAQLTYSIGTGPVYGRLELATAPGVSTSSFTQADIIANRLVYVHDGSETTSDSFTFTVSDGAGGTLGTTTMTLTITPVNDPPTITSDGGASTAAISVAENVSAVTIVTGADVDLPAQALTYNISGGADQALFTINAATGALSFTTPPNFEVATDANGDNIYVVQVRVTDSQGASTTQTIQVTVTDVAEGTPPPTIPPSLLPTTPPGPTGPGPVPSSPAGPSVQSIDVPPPMVPGSGAMPSEFSPASAGPLPTERLVSIRPEEPRETINMAKDPPLFHWDDEARRPLLTGIPVEPTPTLEPEPAEKPQSVSDLLLSKLDEMTASLEQAMDVSQEQRAIAARIAALTGTTLSVGFIAWALRNGALLASFMATMPAWRHFDPLPVLGGSRSERERRREKAKGDQQREAAEFGGLKKLFDPEPPLEPKS